MINWPIVLGAFCAGLALTFYLAAREKIRNRVSPSAAVTGRLLGGLSLMAACAAVGLFVSAASRSSSALTLPTPSPSSFDIRHSTFVTPPTQQPHDAALLSPSSFVLPPTQQPSNAALLPRLQIPSLNIDEPIQTVPIHDGQWDLTTLGTEIGWLATTGARPGDALAMVFVGHITVSEKEHGPFAYLQKIQKDAEVIYRAAGTSYVYQVESISRAGSFDVNRLYLADGNSLLLITCTDWDSTQRVYTNRLMVQARLEN